VAISGTLRFDEFINGWRLTAKDVLDLDRLVEARATGLLLRWRTDVERHLTPEVLKNVLEPHRPGRCGWARCITGTMAPRRGWCWAVLVIRPARELATPGRNWSETMTFVSSMRVRQ
jgi:hypothetical protein